MIDRTVQATSFGAAARAYERGRPPYPPRALTWLLPPGTPRVLDLGAGTGKLTRQLHGLGLHVTAVDPSDGMRRELNRVLPDLPALAGTAEDIPLPDASVDVVLVAQAWHWVDPARAVPEVARVLSPGGRLGLVWNVRDERVDWVADLGRIIGSPPHQDVQPRIGAPFGPVERFDVAWTHDLTRDAVLDMVASRSHVITMAADAREHVLAEVRHLLATHPALAGDGDIAMPYVSHCSRTDLP
jgi:SAM-dependent methyltransferase